MCCFALASSRTSGVGPLYLIDCATSRSGNSSWIRLTPTIGQLHILCLVHVSKALRRHEGIMWLQERCNQKEWAIFSLMLTEESETAFACDERIKVDLSLPATETLPTCGPFALVFMTAHSSGITRLPPEIIDLRLP